ncbi:MAG: DNA-processing protein DprA [Armatimonadetes bacterium]|nr:DNA-processing protein DprA [Armatimonadota bacterium]
MAEYRSAGERAYCLRSRGLWEAAALAEDAGLRDSASEAFRDRLKGGWKPLVASSPIMPPRLRSSLGHSCPPVLWLRGSAMRLRQPGVGIVGSRTLSVDEARFASDAGALLARIGATVFSGGAAGSDSFGVAGTVRAGGYGVHYLPGGEPRRSPEGCLLSRFPEAPEFDRIEALIRNRWIYASSDAVILVSSRFGQGGSWAGAIAARRSRVSPIIVFRGKHPSSGNEALAKLGATSVSSIDELEEALRPCLARPLELAV